MSNTPILSSNQRTFLVTVSRTLFLDSNRGMNFIRKYQFPLEVYSSINTAFSKGCSTDDSIKLLLNSNLPVVREAAGVLNWIYQNSK